MNCRQGDLAVIVRSWVGNEGKIVQCVRLVAGGDEWIEGGPRWEIDRGLPSLNGHLVFSVADCCLRPLRDNDGEDEILQLVRNPVGTPQSA